MNYARTGQPTFYYPVFWFTSRSETLSDTDLVTNFTSGNTTEATATSKTRTIGNLSDIDLDNQSGFTDYIWVAYPTGSPEIVRVQLRVRRGVQDDINSVGLAESQRSSTDLTFISSEAGVPQSAAEDYKWFRIEVPDATRITIGNTS